MMTPAEEIERPGGAPESDQLEIEATDDESEAVTVSGEMATLALEVWFAGAVTVTTFLIV